MRLLSAALCTTVAAALLAGCSGGSGSSPSSSTGGAMPQGIRGAHGRQIVSTIPKWLAHNRPIHQIKAPGSAVKGIATALFFGDDYFVYPKNNSANGPAVCTAGATNVNDLASDSSGNLMVPNAFDGIAVYGPPFSSSSCGTLLGTISDSEQASDAAAINATTGTIVVGNIEGGSTAGVATCTLASLSCTFLDAPDMEELAGVAMDKEGNCYADAFNSSGTVGLWVFAGCTGTGTQLGASQGFNEPYYGGIDIDNKGNLVAIALLNSSFETPSLITVYSGCATGTCTVVGGPFKANGTAEYVFGHVGRQNERFVAGNVFTGIDVYAYGRTSLTYMYSFSNGLNCASDECEAAAYMPNAQR
jgi:hypothetical protein